MHFHFWQVLLSNKNCFQEVKAESVLESVMETTLESHLTYYRQLKQCHKLVICKSVKLQLKGVSVPHNQPYVSFCLMSIKRPNCWK